MNMENRPVTKKPNLIILILKFLLISFGSTGLLAFACAPFIIPIGISLEIFQRDIFPPTFFYSIVFYVLGSILTILLFILSLPIFGVILYFYNKPKVKAFLNKIIDWLFEGIF